MAFINSKRKMYVVKHQKITFQDIVPKMNKFIEVQKFRMKKSHYYVYRNMHI